MTSGAGTWFLFFLAHELKMTKQELLSKVDAYEIAEWLVYFGAKFGVVKKKVDPAALSEKIKAAFMGMKRKGKKRG